MPVINCPIENCDYTTPDVDPVIVAALITTHATVHGATATHSATAKVEKCQIEEMAEGMNQCYSMDGTPYKFAVYLAACPLDATYLDDIKTYLESIKGLHVCIDDPENDKEKEIKISQSRKMVLLVSPNYFDWGPSNLELSLAKGKFELLDRGDVIVVMLPGSGIVHLENHNLTNYINIRYADYNEKKEWLLNYIKDSNKVSRDCLTHFGVGMAFSQFYGYMRLILPKMAEREEMEEMCRKFFIIIPASLEGLPCFCEMSRNIKTLKPIKIMVPRGGNVDRDYSLSVHQIEDATNGKMYKFVGDIPHILISLYEMQQRGQHFPISPAQKRMAIQQFYRYLKFLLDGDAECSGKYAFIYHDDEATHCSQPIGDMILSAIKHEIEQERQHDQANEERPNREQDIPELDITATQSRNSGSASPAVSREVIPVAIADSEADQSGTSGYQSV